MHSFYTLAIEDKWHFYIIKKINGLLVVLYNVTAKLQLIMFVSSLPFGGIKRKTVFHQSSLCIRFMPLLYRTNGIFYINKKLN